MEAAREREVDGGSVIDVVMGDASNGGELVRALCEEREVFAEAQAGNGGWDAAEGTADFFRSVGLGVVGFELALPTAGEDDENRTCGSEPRHASGSHERCTGQDERNADSEEFAACG